MEKLATQCDFETIQLKDDYEGECIATLISAKTNTLNRPAVLYVHGFVDYFFQLHVMEAFDAKGYDFYAIDLRKYGRSKLPHQHPCYCKSVEEYFEEITYSIKKITSQSSSDLFLMGHSTGCITVSMYANKGECKDKVKALILNAPFLDFNIPKTHKFVLNVISGIIAFVNPFGIVMRKLPQAYGRSLHKDYLGEWDYDLAYKPIKGFPTYFSFIHAARKGHRYLRSKSNLTIPILILHSSNSLGETYTKEEFSKSDIVLNVADMVELGPNLGKDVSFTEIKDGLHDVFLSHKDGREFAISETLNWLDGLKLK